MKYKNILRWILVIPSVLFSYLLVIYLAVQFSCFIVPVLPANIIGLTYTWSATGPCLNHSLIYLFFSSLAALVTLACGVYIAPNHKLVVAYIIYFVGGCYAIFLYLVTMEWGILLGSLISGLIYILYFRYQYKKT